MDSNPSCVTPPTKEYAVEKIQFTLLAEVHRNPMFDAEGNILAIDRNLPSRLPCRGPISTFQ